MSRCLVLTALLLSAEVCFADPVRCASPGLEAVAGAAVSPDEAVAAAAIKTLRDAGPPGLNALCDAHRELLADHLGDRAVENDSDGQWDRLRAALDAVGAQRDCYASRLYWHTDLAAACDVARRENKPVLSLRLLGKLTDEFSCANSRFFRTALYANTEISGCLRKRFVLHWESVRAVPRVTVDFGDGRKLERTLTGNSIHYVLDADGRPVDALPGLYGPQAFLRQLTRIDEVLAQAAKLDGEERTVLIARHHRERILATQQAWSRDLARLRIAAFPMPGNPVPAAPSPVEQVAQAVQADQPAAQGQPERVNAAVAEARAVPKSIVESPLRRAIALNPVERLRLVTTDDVWPRIAALHEEDCRLDESSRAMVRRQNPPKDTSDAGSQHVAWDAMIARFQQAMAIDTVRNEYDFRRRIHEWLAAEPALDVAALNDRVYAELFLTPRSDPWLGLDTPDAYTALENGGRSDAANPARP